MDDCQTAQRDASTWAALIPTSLVGTALKQLKDLGGPSAGQSGRDVVGAVLFENDAVGPALCRIVFQPSLRVSPNPVNCKKARI